MTTFRGQRRPKVWFPLFPWENPSWRGRIKYVEKFEIVKRLPESGFAVRVARGQRWVNGLTAGQWCVLGCPPQRSASGLLSAAAFR